MEKHVDIDTGRRYLFDKIGFRNFSLEPVLEHNPANVVPKNEVVRKIFEELETVLYSAVGQKTLDSLHIRIEDYSTIKKKYTEVS